MEKASKELLRDFVNSQHFTSTTDILNDKVYYISQIEKRAKKIDMLKKLW